MSTPEIRRERGRVRVMSWNIRSGFGSFDLPETDRGGSQLATIAAVIRDAGADIVGLQEVDRFWARSGRVDQPRWLAQELRMQWRHAANMLPEGGSPVDGSPQYGVALVSRWEIVDHEHVLLPTPEGWEQRGALLVVIVVPGIGEIAVVTTHLQVDGDRGSAADQRAEGAAIVAELARSRGLPAVITGDLNASPDDDELRSLSGEESGFRDCWTAAHPEHPGLTIPASPVADPEARIDYVFASGELDVRGATVPTSATTRIASDHYPVVADLSLGPEGA